MRRNVLKILLGLSLSLGLLPGLHSQTNLQSQDGYVRREGNDWVFGTSQVERRVRVAEGEVLLTSFRNRISGREYQQAAKGSSEISFLAGGQKVSGWKLTGTHTSQGAQGELRLDLELESGGILATKHYLIYPGTGVIREWITLKNTLAKAIHLSHVGFLNTRLLSSATADLQFSYVTGGGDYNGSQLLKSEPMNASYSRTIDSNAGAQPLAYSGYLPLIFLRDTKANEGVALGWDYMGHWKFEIGNPVTDPLTMKLELAGYEKDLAPGEQMETPKSFLAAFCGGVDELGNQLLDWQYQYLWEFTNPDYFAKTRWAVDWPDPWVGDGGAPSADNWGRRLALDLRYIDLLRETGTDILWDDAGWYDKWGTWSAPDWKQTTDYLRKYDMKWVLWYPTFLATPLSKIGQQHPNWLVPGQLWLEQSIPETAKWQNQQLDQSVKDWGEYQWRYDIAPAASANDTDLLDADQNFRKVLQQFKESHPQSGIDACDGGGRWISYDIAHFAESGEYTDGGVGPYSPYYASLIVPPDKLHNVVDFDHVYYVPESDRTHLAMNPTWYRDPGDGPDVEAIRKDWELYHYMVAQGVAGRWSHVFRPKVKHDDPIWYFQRMNRDGSKGVIITKHAKSGASYFVTSHLKGGSQPSDQYRGGAASMNMMTTTSAADIATGIYEDTVDGAVRFYGVPGQGFGPLNVIYQNGAAEQSLVTKIVKLGAARKVESRFFGMELQPRDSMTVTQLGQFDPANRPGTEDFRGNQGTYTLSLIRAADGAVMATADLDTGNANPDAMGFKYARLSQPVHLATAMEPVTIYPQGLQPATTYDVRTIHSGLRIRETGAKLMADGISLSRIAPGELVFFNLPSYPGSGSDHVVPAAPSQVTKRTGTNLGAQGIELSWSPGHDENWISFYEIRKNGKLLGKTAKGTFFFDHSGTAREDLDAEYEVCTVDGDGNRSSFVTAQKTSGSSRSYEALGDFSPTQAVQHWTYEEQLADGSYRDLRWDNGGYEGRWVGSGLGKIGRIWMQPSAHYDLSRTFVAPGDGVLSLSGSIRKDPSAATSAVVSVKIMRNSDQLWPEKGWAQVPGAFDTPAAYEVKHVKISAKDKIRFVVKHNEENRADPIEWNPKITTE